MASQAHNLTERLTQLLEPTIQAEGLELWALEHSGGSGRLTLRVYLESPNGVTVDDCARISRALGALLDVDDPIAGRYNLEVSSPGINRVLVKPEHFKRFIGERVRVKTRRPVLDNMKNCLGILSEFHEEPPAITVQTEQGDARINLGDIVKAMIDFPFEDVPVPKR